MMNNLDDVAGIRVICSFVDDIYSVANMLVSQDDITVIAIKDYIKNPKPNGPPPYPQLFISLFACSHNTRSPASDYIRCIRTRVFKMQTPDMLKIPESGLIHFLLYWLRYKKITAAHINSSIKKNTARTLLLDKSRIYRLFISNVLAMFIIVEQPVQQKFRGGHAEQADTLEFSLCAPVASRPERPPCLSAQSARVWVAGLAIGGGAHEVQNSTQCLRFCMTAPELRTLFGFMKQIFLLWGRPCSSFLSCGASNVGRGVFSDGIKQNGIDRPHHDVF